MSFKTKASRRALSGAIVAALLSLAGAGQARAEYRYIISSDQSGGGLTVPLGTGGVFPITVSLFRSLDDAENRNLASYSVGLYLPNPTGIAANYPSLPANSFTGSAGVAPQLTGFGVPSSNFFTTFSYRMSVSASAQTGGAPPLAPGQSVTVATFNLTVNPATPAGTYNAVIYTGATAPRTTLNATTGSPVAIPYAVTNLSITVQSVPEPGSLVLLGLGVGLVALRLGRRGRRPAAN